MRAQEKILGGPRPLDPPVFIASIFQFFFSPTQHENLSLIIVAAIGNWFLPVQRIQVKVTLLTVSFFSVRSKARPYLSSPKTQSDTALATSDLVGSIILYPVMLTPLSRNSAKTTVCKS